jgi:hypothetical protein
LKPSLMRSRLFWKVSSLKVATVFAIANAAPCRTDEIGSFKFNTNKGYRILEKVEKNVLIYCKSQNILSITV